MEAVATAPERATVRRPWTRREEIEACTLRWLGVKLGAISRRLSRSRGSVRVKLDRLGFSRRKRHREGALTRAVKRLHAKGLNDSEIALRLGVHRTAPFAIRKRCGLKANTGPGGWRGESGDAGANAVRLKPECWGCGTRCPNGNHLASAGWVSRRMEGYTFMEIFCGTCWKRYGWGDELSTRTEGQPS